MFISYIIYALEQRYYQIMILEAWNLRRGIATHYDCNPNVPISIALTHLAYRAPIPRRVNESFAAKGTIIRLFNPHTIQLSTLCGSFH